MINDLRKGRFAFALLPPACLLIALAITTSGCGSTEEGTEDWALSSETQPPPESPEYQLDSVKNENRRLKDQLDAMAAENRNLTARNAELETKLTDAANAPQTVAPAPAPATHAMTGDISSAYSAALAKFRSRNYSDAAQDFEAILNAGADEKIADNCHYWIGESMYGLRRYDDAMKQFETVLGYAGSGKRPAAQLMIGNVYAAQGNKAAARDAWEKVVSTYPTSDLAQKAKEKLDRSR
jgi:tol-pal system protein YbgF